MQKKFCLKATQFISSLIHSVLPSSNSPKPWRLRTWLMRNSCKTTSPK